MPTEISIPLEAILSVIIFVLRQLFGEQAPEWFLTGAAWIILVFLFLLCVWAFLWLFSQIAKLWRELFRPLFYNPSEKRRRTLRQHFARHIQLSIWQLDRLESWQDYRFAELEAEVEAEGQWQASRLWPLHHKTRGGLRRERSLSRALASSRERLILLEGTPGSGKSVALRHVAHKMAGRVTKALSTKAVIPIYVNLKELERRRSQDIDRNLIESFVLQTLRRANDRDIEEFLEEEFDRGLKEGTWLFLFDSFDELPELLSSTEADAAIRDYAMAIESFLHGMNQCRGIIASRQFKGPGRLGWPRFRVLPLSEKRRVELVRKAELRVELKRELFGQLGIADQGTGVMISNPMFLGLICEYMKSGHPFPENLHSVFETYLTDRLARDADRLWARYKLRPQEMRRVAEQVAFCITAEPGLGLTPTRDDIKRAMAHLGFNVAAKFDTQLDALEYLKLARSETTVVTGPSRPFTFAHRRFQEYFSTCVVLREPERIPARHLLTDARWRETAVVLCQTQASEMLSLIVEEARSLLIEMTNTVLELSDDPLERVQVLESAEKNDQVDKDAHLISFPWPSNALHILGLLQESFSSQLDKLPDDIRMNAGRLLLAISETGTLLDKKWGLEVAGIVPRPVLLWLLRQAFASRSQLLKEVAYRQVARLGQVPEDVAKFIHRALLRLFAEGKLSRERHTIYAHLSRIDRSAHCIYVMRILQVITFVDLVLHTGTLLILLYELVGSRSALVVWLLSVAAFAVMSYLSLWGCARVISGLSGSLSWVLDVLSVEVRMLSPIVGFVVFLDLPDSSLQFLILLLFWPVLALLSVQSGQFVRSLWLPLTPIWPLVYALRNLKALAKMIALLMAEIILFMLAMSMSCGLLVVGLETENGVLGIVGLVASATMVIPFAREALRISFYLTMDWCRWRRWVRKPLASMTVQQFLLLVSQYHFSMFRDQVVRTVRQRGMLVATKDSEALLRAMAFAVEYFAFAARRRRERNTASGFKQMVADIRSLLDMRRETLPEYDQSLFSQSESFRIWFAQSTSRSRQWLINAGPNFLDETYLLLEQIRAVATDEP